MRLVARFICCLACVALLAATAGCTDGEDTVAGIDAPDIDDAGGGDAPPDDDDDPPASEIIDQAVPLADADFDIAKGEKSHQSFTVGVTGQLTAIELAADRNGGDGLPHGSDAVIRIRADDGANGPAGTLLAQGTLSRTQLTDDVVTWVRVDLAVPLAITVGDVLYLTIEETSGGGDNGWNDYAIADGDPYADGAWRWGSYSDDSGSDLSFRTLVVPASPKADG